MHVKLLVMAAAALGSAVIGREARAEPPVRCERVEFSVSLTTGGPADQTVVAWLCARGEVQGKTIQVLIHGSGYDHNYWDFPFQPETYSYVRTLTSAGYAVLNLDRLGDGESSHPPNGAALTLHTGALSVHQIVGALRSGDMVVPAFGRVRAERVMLVGHSFGALIASIEASSYGDVDGVILSSSTHTPGSLVPFLFQTLYPAFLDPKFAGSGLPPTYLTNVPGSRAIGFFSQPNADPAVIALDEQLKQTLTVGEAADINNALPTSAGIHTPSLVVVGNFDFVVCQFPSCTASNVLATEPAFFPSDACVEVNIVPDSGHFLNLHRNAQDWYAIAREWSDRRVGAVTRNPPPQPCP
jgi:pimeloyl-ACP methyl ester carboxylesterase